MDKVENTTEKKATTVVVILAFLGKVLGFIRQTMIAGYYGSNWQTDAFFFASSMPTYFFPGIAGAISTALITIYVSLKVKDGKKRSDGFASNIILAVLSASLILCLVAVIACPVIIKVFAPGFEGEQSKLAVVLTRITFSAYMLSIGCGLFGAILNAQKFFISTEIAALSYNIVIIVATIILGRNQGVYSLTWTFVAGHIVQFLFVFFFAIQHFHFKTDRTLFFSDNKKLVLFGIPIVLSYGLASFNGLVDQVLGSLLGEGAVSAISYSNSINSIVSGVFIATLSSIMLPSLSEYAEENRDAFVQTLNGSIKYLMLLLLPISCFFFVESKDLVSLIYGRGAFSQDAVKLTSETLVYYAWMYPFVGIYNIYFRGFYALKDSKSPLLYGGVAVSSNAIISVVLSKIIGIGGLALGTTISYVISSISLVYAMKRKVPEKVSFFSDKSILKMILATLIMLLVSLFVVKKCENLSILWRFFVVGGSGASVYCLVLLLTKCNELVSLVKVLPLRNNKRNIEE